MPDNKFKIDKSLLSNLVGSDVIQFEFDCDIDGNEITLSIGFGEGRHYSIPGESVEIGIKVNRRLDAKILAKALGYRSVDSTVEGYADEETLWRVKIYLDSKFGMGFSEAQKFKKFTNNFFTYEGHDTSNAPIQSLNNTYEENAKLVEESENGCDCGNPKCKWTGSFFCQNV